MLKGFGVNLKRFVLVKDEIVWVIIRIKMLKFRIENDKLYLNLWFILLLWVIINLWFMYFIDLSVNYRCKGFVVGVYLVCFK